MENAFQEGLEEKLSKIYDELQALPIDCVCLGKHIIINGNPHHVMVGVNPYVLDSLSTTINLWIDCEGSIFSKRIETNLSVDQEPGFLAKQLAKISGDGAKQLLGVKAFDLFTFFDN